MSLIELWQNQKSQIEQKHIQQIIAFSGSGQLKDGSDASSEFREFLSSVPSDKLTAYANQCLENSFPGSGFALQDIVNQVGVRLGFDVIFGRYRGVQGKIGYDGLWKFPSCHAVIVEVKTSDAYRINLETVANYREQLIKEGDTNETNTSALIVVGRKDTGDLEAQIRGSRHAWDMRLISIDALMNLMLLKENVEEPQTIQRIHDILIPREFTKLDEIIDILFSTAEDVKEEEPVDEDEDQKEKTPKFIPVSFNDACKDRIEEKLKTSFLKKSKASYYSSDKSARLICAVSKEYERGNQIGYWFAFHPHQKDFLEEVEKGYVAFGCGDKSRVILISAEKFISFLDNMNITQKEDRFYWHVQILRTEKKFFMHFKKEFKDVDITEYLIQ